MWAKHKQSGFTIVELLIVIVVIGILTAITIVSYNGIQSRSRAAAVTSALTQASGKLALYFVENNTYPASLAAIGINDSASVSYQYAYDNSVNPQTYCVTATNSTTSYKASSLATTPVSGGCAGHGVGGVAAISNWAVNPSFEANLIGWNSSGISMARSSIWSSSGASSAKLTNNSTADTGDIRLAGGGATTFPPGLAAGGTYTVSARLQLDAPLSGDHNRTLRVMYFYSVNGSSFTESFGPKATNTVGSHLISHTFTIPATATGVVLGLGGSSSVIGDYVYYDDVMITNGSGQPQYADGGTANWVWNSLENNSFSTGPQL